MSRSLEIMGEACVGLQMVRKRMFGGHGFFAPNGGMFAGIVTDDAIVLKLARGVARDELIALGGHPWVYEGRDQPTTMHEWIVIPDAFYDDTEALHTWLVRAHGLAPAKARGKSKTAKKVAGQTIKRATPIRAALPKTEPSKSKTASVRRPSSGKSRTPAKTGRGGT